MCPYDGADKRSPEILQMCHISASNPTSQQGRLISTLQQLQLEVALEVGLKLTIQCISWMH